ncbi:uncharacterized protein LOC115073421 [Rhinatrema bivittatum]|uniref:uncharacterized protein LOC115073421 n=1 Tax=Rhinatrema bivittatum TaxID=194408 RepID=UPI00112C91C5|nr:uncharacterized protein LOC115073421 [Rhinatrema bivittatum]
MIGNCKRLGLLPGVLYGLILCMKPVTTSPTPCLGCGNQTLIQSRDKAQLMESPAQELFMAYVFEQDLQSYDFICDEPVAWFPAKGMSKLPKMQMLKEIYRTLLNLGTAFVVMVEQQTALNPESSLLEKLNAAERSVKGLESNIFCYLCSKKAFSDKIFPSDMPSTADVYDQKREGCRVLKSYSEFIKEVFVGLKRISMQGSKKQRSRKLHKTALHSILSK